MLWRIQITKSADRDFANILRDSEQKFGRAQAEIYQRILSAALDELTAGPEILGSQSKTSVRPGLRILHVARKNRSGRHMLVYAAQKNNVILILRILHDAMDLARHV